MRNAELGLRNLDGGAIPALIESARSVSRSRMGRSNSRVIATGKKTGATRSPQKLQAILVAPETVAQISEYQSQLASIGTSGPRSPRPDCQTFSEAAFVMQPACGRLANTRVLNGPGRIKKLAGGAADAET